MMCRLHKTVTGYAALAQTWFISLFALFMILDLPICFTWSLKPVAPGRARIG